MRNAFAQVLTELAKSNDKLVLFYADIGNRLFNPLKEFAESRTINAGIAEANMASMAAGSAMMGHKPFIYTITPFTTARNFEQIKIDIAYQNQPVIIVGTGSGLSYANLGPTHHSFEDIALMRALPNMNVVCPADAQELELLMPQLIELNQPCYFRIGKKNEPSVHASPPKLVFGKAHIMKHGHKVAILSTGTIMPLAQQLCAHLKAFNIDAELVSFHTVKPLDKAYLEDAANRFVHLVTLEEHNVNGGFGSAVLEYVSDNDLSVKVHRFGIPDFFIDQVHNTPDARDKAGLNIETLSDKLKQRGVM
ncbi:transketolase family protein [Pseudoalteromonas byunsanensis]|uniref:Transketolase n=1 Tax=Pseudoalteromonas byunsanensis TaxID=327939 RepID=A0A1S1NAR1_9GAMM|nr:transketolase C-terminal domain-containing protein [Pseudoalteromonas byunsanensis]OHU95789.1 transketolase [Pseudoalteromonas byunsanensis]